MKKHFGWTVYGILGYIFAPMGALFAAIGLFVGQSLNARWQSPEDPVIFRAIFCGVGGESPVRTSPSVFSTPFSSAL